jgi:hypothetical protein
MLINYFVKFHNVVCITVITWKVKVIFHVTKGEYKKRYEFEFFNSCRIFLNM